MERDVMILLEGYTRTAINPALALLPAHLDTPKARVMLLAIGRQESRFMHRAQVVAGRPGVKGPARGFWQFEAGGGVRGVMRHDASRALAQQLCLARHQPWDEKLIHVRLEHDDTLAAGFARLLLLTDPRPLPSIDEPNHDEAWDYYVRNWRPGKPHRSTWDAFHDEALAQVFH
jgi:hypothetical protein